MDNKTTSKNNKKKFWFHKTRKKITTFATDILILKKTFDVSHVFLCPVIKLLSFNSFVKKLVNFL